MHEDSTPQEHIAPLPVMKGEGRAFRYALWPVLLVMVLLIVFAGFPTWMLTGISRLPTLLIMGIGSVIVSVIPVLAIYRYRINVDGIRGWDAWGFPMAVRWSEIVEVKPLNLIVLRYVRLICEGSPRAMWFPLCLHRMEEAAALIREYAPPDSPLHAFMGQHAAGVATEKVRP